jgi:acetyl coenzyme A synthetase (ADP forming)-like protein
MLESLLCPKAVAVIGASRTPGKVGHDIVANLKAGGFQGQIVPVNPSANEIVGLKCYPDLKAFGDTIDMSVIAVPTRSVKAAVDSSIQAGAKSVVIITAGFREVGHEGAELEKEIAQMCNTSGVRLLGPNCLGLINTHHCMNASFAKHMPQLGEISVISQSGALATAILDWAAARHLGLAKMISIGNKADLSEIDFLSALAQDEQTKVIVGYLESIVSGDEFIKVAESAASVKPVVILKSGTTSAGVKAATSHTGSLAGADIAYGAAFRRAGVIRAATFEELFDYATALAMQPLPKGDRVAIITNAGGPGIMAADAVEHSGMTVANLNYFTATALKKKLPAAASVGNPIDVLGDADPDRYATALNAALDDDSVDAIIVILTPQAMTRPAETARAVAGCIRGNKPVLAAFMGGQDVMPGREELVASNLPDYTSPERAVAALKAMCEYAAWRRRPPRIVTRFPVNRRRVERVIARHVKLGQSQILEVEAKEILRAYDFTVPPGEVATTADEALEIALRVGYPVAMKIVSPDIVHKSDVGGVRVSLTNPEAVRDAFDLMMLRIQRRAPEARLEGVYVEKMAPRGREVIIGMSRDPQFGPMLMFGLGGIFVEVMKDVTFHLAPITADEAMQMLLGTRSYALLKGARGQTGVDLTSIANSLQRISQLVTDFPQIAELDINPLIVGEVGTEAVVADARMTLSGVETQHGE